MSELARLASDMAEYEQGELAKTEVVTLFQTLIDSGLVWTLQGSYGRQARRFIDAGDCHERVEENKV